MKKKIVYGDKTYTIEAMGKQRNVYEKNDDGESVYQVREYVVKKKPSKKLSKGKKALVAISCLVVVLVVAIAVVNIFIPFGDRANGFDIRLVDGKYVLLDYAGEESDVVIPNNVEIIGQSAFSGNTKLKSVTIGNSVTSIGEGAFRSCDSLTSVTIGHSVTSIGDYAFYGCTSLSSVTIENSVTSIGDEAFRYCTSLSSVTIGNSVTSIGSYAFDACTSLTSVTIGNSVTSIGEWAFSSCNSLSSVTIGNSVTNIGYDAFAWCTSLSSVTIGNSATRIGYQAFQGCTSLSSVNYLGTIEQWCGITFGDYYANPLYYAKKLYLNGELLEEDLVIPSTVTEIKACAFEGCSSLTSVTIPDSVTSIGYDTFSNCTSLSSINYLGTIEQWCGITFGGYDGNPLSNGAKLYLNGELVEDLVIPNTVTEIKDYAFVGCTSLSNATIPDSVTSIGDEAFAFCFSLSSVTIGNSVTSIGERAFYACTSLSSVNYLGTIEQWCGITFDDYFANPLDNGAKLYLNGELVEDIVIPNTITEIKAYAFRGCDSITSVTIPDSVTSIESGAFGVCDSLSTVYYNGTEEEWSGISIGSSNYDLTGATIYYYSETEPVGAGNYWHYGEDGEFSVWPV